MKPEVSVQHGIERIVSRRAGPGWLVGQVDAEFRKADDRWFCCWAGFSDDAEPWISARKERMSIDEAYVMMRAMQMAIDWLEDPATKELEGGGQNAMTKRLH